MSPRSELAPIAHREAQRREAGAAEAEHRARRELERDPGSARLSAALALALLDQGRVEAARSELERVLSLAAEPSSELSEQEFEAAFELAEPEAEQLMDADRVAEQALREVELGPADEISPPGSDESVFATRTMAELLERQGDRAGAARIRSRLDRSRAPQAGGASTDRRGRVVRELERWLENLRTEA